MSLKVPFRKKLAFELFRKYRKNAKILHQLNYIFWECTLRCNLNCLHCGSDCKKESQVKDMPVKDFISAIDNITPLVNPNTTMVVLTGGEPLLRNDLEICGKQLYERGFPWGIVSNGLQFTSKRFESLLKAGLRAVTISLDGLETSHNWLRGNPKSFENAIRAIEILSKTPVLRQAQQPVIKQTQQHVLRYDVVSCINQKNFNELESLKELLLSKGVKEWRIFTIFPIGRAAQYGELQLTPLQFKQLMDFMVAVRKEGRIKLNYGCEGFLGKYEGEVRDNLFFCRAGINVASVLIDGSLAACPNLRGNFIQGNIYKDSFKDIWENKYAKFRNRDWMKTGECLNCEVFKYCEGNGMHLRSESTDELLVCHYHKLIEGEKVQVLK